MTDDIVPEWTLDGVLDELVRIDKGMKDRQFAFILGAGASFTSGIPTGRDLAQRWLKDLHSRECFDGRSLQDWIANCGIGEGKLSLQTAADHYPQIFARRFDGDSEAGYAELETAMEGKSPSLGYSLLAEIIQHTRHKVVVTTNFDNLVVDALAMHAHQSPLVVAHESLAGFVRPQLRRPLVAKIHRDLFLHPINDPAGVSSMEQGWKTALKKLFQYFTPIVVGYGGNDGSLMNMLGGLEAGDIAGRMVWCFREGSPPPAMARNVLHKHKGLLVKIAGFDEFMLQLAAKLVANFDVGDIAERTAKLGQQRAERYREQAKKLLESSARGSVEAKKAGAVLSESVKSSSSWWAWEMRAQAASDLAERKRIYEDGMKQFPRSAELACNCADFLADQCGDYDGAQAMYEKALELRPEDAIFAGNYASFLGFQRVDEELAEAMFKKSLALDPESPRVISTYARFLSSRHADDDEAERLYKKALALDPEDVTAANSYADFLVNRRGDFAAAEAMYKRGLEMAPLDTDNMANYASALLIRGDEASEREIATLIERAVEVSRPKVEQSVAEGLLYLSLLNETNGAHPDAMRRLKGALQIGYARALWDFSQLFDAVLPRIPELRRELYVAVGEAILNNARLQQLETMPAWRKLKPIDPFAQ
jgi:Tfp pilus assembly protein PilF